ncbi:DUF7537 family lipoprotein [Haloparvum sp. PAK95]|uniref:DUF7537 family lipoprotein n=1 Tax=Haloparvum sp. PAK95 TaxID=3418962 RepID=UPI003D2F11A5
MQRRTLLASAATLATAGLAGCSGLGGDGGYGGGNGGDGDGTPTPVPASDVEWREGDGLNVEVLLESHTTALVEAGSFRVVSTADTSHDGDERPKDWLFSQTYESRFELERERQFLEQDLTELEETQTAYVADGTALYRIEKDGEVQYSSEPVERTTAEFKKAMEQEAGAGVRGLDQWALSVDGAVARDGRELTRFVADEFTGERGIPSEIESASAEVLIDSDGVVRSISQTWEGTHEEQSVTVGVDIEFQGVGETTVAEPEWADEARSSGGTATESDGSNTSGKLRGGL